ncbi:MAG: hypothetical protein JXR03_06775 [Cyclobacteriaceae bacterium]
MKWLEKHRDSFIANWFQVNGLGLFVSLCLLYYTSFIIKRMLIIDGIAAFEILEERGEMWIFDLFFGLQYLTVPIFLLWKFCFTTFILWVGCFMFGYRVTFSQVWKLVMIFEIVFVIPEFLKVIWFTAVYTDPNYFDYAAFYPLSLINLFDYESLSDKWMYPLKAFNMFEIVYWGLLASGIFFVSEKKWKTSAIIVLTSYVLFFFIWIGFYLLAYK